MKDYIKKGFDVDKYLSAQSKKILERVSNHDKLYLEFGGKLFHDKHAKRVLPGYDENTKIRLLKSIKDDLEVIVAVYSKHIEGNKVIGDSNISYELACFRLIDDIMSEGIEVNSVVITRYESGELIDSFISKLENKGIKVYKQKKIEGYPYNVEEIVSPNGFGANDYIETKKKVVLVTGAGAGSGKLSVCLSQLYNDGIKNIDSGYAKFETFPVWDMPLDHPLNIAYESATADLKDIVIPDPYYLKKFGKIVSSYNRDIESFKILKVLLDIIGKGSYDSPTEMGVNMIKQGIIDDEIIREASKQEIIRRELLTKVEVAKGISTESTLNVTKKIMTSMNLKETDRLCCKRAREKKLKVNDEIIALEFPDGFIVTGRSKEILNSSAAAVVKALKYYANIPESIDLIPPKYLESIKKTKNDLKEGDSTYLLDLQDVLVALSMLAADNENAKKALSKLYLFEFAKGHSTNILNLIDEKAFIRLGVDITTDSVFNTDGLYYNRY